MMAQQIQHLTYLENIKANDKFNYLRLSKTQKSYCFILAGMQYSKGDAVVFMAGDMQDPI